MSRKHTRLVDDDDDEQDSLKDNFRDRQPLGSSTHEFPKEMTGRNASGPLATRFPHSRLEGDGEDSEASNVPTSSPTHRSDDDSLSITVTDHSPALPLPLNGARPPIYSPTHVVFPEVILHSIASFLSLPDVNSLMTTCTEWHDSLCKDAVWKRLFLARFPHTQELVSSGTISNNFRHVYIQKLDEFDAFRKRQRKARLRAATVRRFQEKLKQHKPQIVSFLKRFFFDEGDYWAPDDGVTDKTVRVLKWISIGICFVAALLFCLFCVIVAFTKSVVVFALLIVAIALMVVLILITLIVKARQTGSWAEWRGYLLKIILQVAWVLSWLWLGLFACLKFNWPWFGRSVPWIIAFTFAFIAAFAYLIVMVLLRLAFPVLADPPRFMKDSCLLQVFFQVFVASWVIGLFLLVVLCWVSLEFLRSRIVYFVFLPIYVQEVVGFIFAFVVVCHLIYSNKGFLKRARKEIVFWCLAMGILLCLFAAQLLVALGFGFGSIMVGVAALFLAVMNVNAHTQGHDLRLFQH